MASAGALLLAATTASVSSPSSVRISLGGTPVGYSHVTSSGFDGRFSSSRGGGELRAGGSYRSWGFLDLGAVTSWSHPYSSEVHAFRVLASALVVMNPGAPVEFGAGLRFGLFVATEQLVGWRPGGPVTYPPPERYTATYVGLAGILAVEARIRIAPQVQLGSYLDLGVASGTGSVRNAQFEPYLGSYLTGRLESLSIEPGIAGWLAF